MSAERIAIVGAGLMGHGIAQVFAEAGHPVALYDPNEPVLASANERIAANLRALARDTDAVRHVTLHPTLEEAVRHAQFVFEAGPEKLAIKQAIFIQLEAMTDPEAVLATNTSVIPVGQIAADVRSAHRVVGTHWWNPPYLIPLVEVVQAARTTPTVIRRTSALLARVGKEPVHVRRDVPGFVGNRLQHALWREAFALIAAGVCDAETVDRVVKTSFGARLAVMGPIENADYIGLDLTLDIHQHILPSLDRTEGPSPYLRELVAHGKLGMKSGSGFLTWGKQDSKRARDRLLRHLDDQQKAQP
ncbi:MAG TPA: 3-hydroxyacyl-CoA dehydrogenase family protein [Solirubrobacteraceae bacterium]|jgi:3-hydroxybutyryl-CoA dehydrogenase